MEILNRNDLLKFGGGLTVAFGSQLFYDQRCYYEAMEAYLAASETERRSHFEDNIHRFSPTLHQYVEKYKYNPLWGHLHQDFLRVSVIVSLMSAFEHYLNNICMDVGTILRIPLTLSELKGGCIMRAKTFLVKLGKLSRPNETIWKSISDIQKLRNILVHNAGILDVSSRLNEVQNISRNLPGIYHDNETGFSIQPELCLYCLDLIEKFHQELSTELQEVCLRIQQFEKSA